MESYQNFIGVDIGKFTFVASLHGQKETSEYDNTPSGISDFLKAFASKLDTSLVVLETTGGYEMKLLLTLCKHKKAVHRANTRKVKNFIRSYGNKAKTDKLDAKALALYGYERHAILGQYEPPSSDMLELYSLIQRRRDLKQILVAEKNRKQGPNTESMQSSFEAIITVLNEEIERISDAIEKLITSDETLSAVKKVLKTVPGIGNIVAQEILGLVPEIGTLSRREIASLAGLAPRANDSGNFKGYRHTGHGRDIIKPMLYMSAMAARGSKSELKIFYENLTGRGKKKMVALTALMRKIIVIANAKVRDYYIEQSLNVVEANK